MREIIARIVDGSRFHEYQPNYGTTLVCGFANIWGYKVGILANNGVLFNDSSLKGGHFIELCNQNATPLVFLQNITGYMVGREYERRGITKDGAKMIMAQACSRVPKFTDHVQRLVRRRQLRHVRARLRRASAVRLAEPSDRRDGRRPGGQYAGRGQAQPDEAQRRGDRCEGRDRPRVRNRRKAAYQEQLSAYYSTSELWDDGILDPVDTRNALGVAISASLNAPLGEPGYGVFRF